jgi:serine/threonine protein kinase
MSEATPPPPSMLDAPEALPPGTRVGEFEIRRLLGSGGFGIVYLAWDHALEREVALKEYMPGTLAGRGAGLQVSVRSKSTADTFALGLRSFINEARLLARFDHPSLVKVYRFWEDNGTAYMVMPHYVGRTLRQVRQGMVVPPGEGACRRVLDALLSALETLHREGVYHRDIAPDNILIGDDGLPVLLDFGAARRVLGDRTQALTSIMKPHFAPLEQYADGNAMRQGPWTDLYALGGTVYYLITGQEPVPAASRALHDDQPRLVELRPRDCSQGFLAAIDWMLALKPPERPQSVYMLRDVLDGRITLPGRIAADRTMPGVAAYPALGAAQLLRTDIDPTSPDTQPADDELRAPAATMTPLPRTAAPAEPEPAMALAQAAGTTGPRSARAALAWMRSPYGLLAGLLLLNVLAWWWFTRTSAPRSPEVPTAAAAAAAPVAATTAMPALGPAVRPAETQASETILSILPARVPALRTDAGAGAVIGAGALRASEAAPRAREVGESRAVVGDLSGLGPRERCGDRNFLSLLICMKRECGNVALRDHPECVKMREQEEAHRGRQ